MKFAAISLSVIILTLAQWAFAQSSPSQIRGYKVYDPKIIVVNADDVLPQSTGANVAVRLLRPKVVGIGVTGVTVEVGAELTALDRSGSVDLMTFQDFRVNGVPVAVAEYDHQFSFTKGAKIILSNPARVSINTINMAKGAFKELMDPGNEWAITGTVFVFGKFKKMGIGFKRVVPVKIDLKIKDLLR